MAHVQPSTSHDVAKLAGVSQPTVSRALRGDSRLSEETRQRVRDAAAALHYVPSQRGRSLATRTTGQIGIVVSDLGNSFYLEVLDHLHEELREDNLRMVVLTPESHDRISLERLVDGSVDGVILTTTLLDSSLPYELGLRGLPFVLLNREVDDCPGDICVVDNELGGRLVAEEMLALGHTEIAAIFGPDTTSTGRDREAGFRSVLAEAGMALGDERWRRCRFDFGAGHQAALELLAAAAKPPTAIFCANDIIALGAFNALHGAGLRLPADLTLIGFDDVLLASWEVFQLTTVRQDIPRMVKVATELLLARLGTEADAPTEPRRVVLPPALVRRKTHGPPPPA
ncbi:MAG TPA: LacI family DNA-binding transcriptional regulator [Solirubrobacteraceae bacterium]|nr:LacI family DNA-binding transcriptional regulator [Solirubrobacteraceae bacterium]